MEMETPYNFIRRFNIWREDGRKRNYIKRMKGLV